MAVWKLDDCSLQDAHQRTKELQVNAHRCARIAENTFGLELAEELQADFQL